MITTCGRIARIRRVEAHDVYDIDLDDKKNETGRTAKPGYEELTRAFLRNRVSVELKTSEGPIVSCYDNLLEDLYKQISDFCDERFRGFWMWETSYRQDSDWDNVTHRSTYPGTGHGHIVIYAEHDEDLEIFLKDCAVLIKLAN